ncbi:cyclic-phosphate processing receiver domain-containing protein [Chengkuizengella marina]|uniref:Cell division protein FtsJ n=1 Tax=Chengkuizengella marina TaxID=2507566 RepID=A0A6N9PWE9_9BACL|nr:cyclic-phosphate processing receiver domain-containing protein [Chengkuizengella marina]NBI27849.1 cell division protein FtsJ [Chengkuizengella marina]
MINVYLDDLRPCPKGFVLAKNIEECIVLLQESNVNILSLDFDLGWNEPTGYDLTKMMVEKKCYAKEIYLHTSDSNGRMKMYQLLYQHKPDDVVLHNGPMPYELLEQYM